MPEMERIYVTVRARPLSSEDSKSSPWRISGNSISLAAPPTKFDFDRIFGEECRTVELYEARTKEIVASAVRGFNCTVFAYGQTNSGKTHTMRGSVAEPGVIPLAVHDLFRIIEEDVDREFLLRMSYMEIYNEEINDLLVPEHRRLQIHESLDRGIYVAGLREEIVTSPEQVLDLIEFGESHRHIGETNMNLYSSRSHTIFRMIIESRERTEDGDDSNNCGAVRVSVLNLVDLAGSERAAKTGAEGMRLKEGSHINKSLMTLGTVIKKLSEGAESQGGHVPYRDSKLTRILQPALGGNANTAIICNITLAQVHTDETKSSLQFASRALRVKNCACVNEILTDAALLKRQRKEIEELRTKLLASHSEHWEEEILNLRNTLLQSELEKERMALELEEEKKAKALRERRLLEQAQKIANLSSLVLCSERDEKSSHITKNKRRVTWCPGPSSEKMVSKVSYADQVSTNKMYIKDPQDMGLLLPFEELTQDSEISAKDHHSNSKLPDNRDNDLEFSFPDAHALLNVTCRRKHHQKGTELLLGSDELVEKHLEIADQTLGTEIQRDPSRIEIQSLKGKLAGLEITLNRTHSISQQNECTCGHKGQESEAILVIKQLQDQIKSLELEKDYIQRNLDNVVELMTEQTASFREKYEELHQEVPNACEEAKKVCEIVCSPPTSTSEVLKFEFSSKLSLQIQGVELEFGYLRETIDNYSSIIEGFLENFSILSEELRELKAFSIEDMTRFESIVSGYNQLHSYMKQKIDELELEKNLLHSQSIVHQQQIKELKSDIADQENTLMGTKSQHELEKDDLLCQILSLQKEVSALSTSSLAREKETLRKELDKAKLKLKDTESRLKNCVQEKIKLESEKAQAERELKHLHGQRTLLGRDMRKRDSLIDKRHESKSSDLSKTRGFSGMMELTLQDDYHKLEVHAFEMEAAVASLKEALEVAIEEKQNEFSRNEILNLELEAMTNSLNSASCEIESLKEELAGMKRKLDEAVFISKESEAALDLLSREKEEMALQLTDALLELEVEKSTWLAKEKVLTESNERMKISDNEVAKLSTDLIEVRRQLDACQDQCGVLTKELDISEKDTEQEKACSMKLSSEITKLKNELNQYLVDRAECTELKSKLEDVSSAHHRACEEISHLQEKLSILAQEKDSLSVQGKQIDSGADFSNDYKNLKNQYQEILRERDNLLSQNVALEAALAEAKILERNYDNVLSEARKNLAGSTAKLSTLETRMCDEELINNKERTKLRLQNRSMQVKLDMFRRRYESVVDEMRLMNRKFEEASSKLKEQLRTYGIEILRLNKQLATRE